MNNSRTEAVFIISRWLVSRDFPDRMIESETDHAFITDMVYTTIRNYAALEWVLQQLLKKTPGGETLAALLLGSAQILLMDDVADHAAVHETVDAAKLRSGKSTALVNAVLRNIIRNREQLLKELRHQPLHIRESHPEALVRRWLTRHGAEAAEQLCRWNNQPARTFITRRPAEDGQSFFEPVPRGQRIQDMQGYEEGEFIVQDPSTAASIQLLDLRPGSSVLDGCASPGGKTIQIAWRAEQSKIVATDLHNDRIRTLTANLQRTGMTHVQVAQVDLAADLSEFKECHGVFDRILLDVPCSNTGVLSRRPDARWRWSEKRMQRIVRIQQKLLSNAVTLLAPEGTLVYSTCSLEPEENSEVIHDFISNNPLFSIRASVEQLPFRTQTDGGFACALKKSYPPI